MVRLAAPLALLQVGLHTMGLVDAAMLGRYSEAALAGAGVGNNLFFLVSCVGMGIVMGMDTVVPQALGGNRCDDAHRLRRAAVRLALFVGLATTLLVLASPLLLVLAGAEAEVMREARTYTSVRALGAVPFLVSVALRSYLAAHAITRPLVLAVVLGNLANVALDYALIFGVPALSIPALGAAGAAFATTLVQVLVLGVFVVAVRRLDREGAAGASRAPALRADMREIVRYGAPVGGQLLAEVGIFGIATILAAHLGKVPAAAHAIALGLSSFTFSFSLGVASAASVRVGHAVGAGDIALARRRGLLALRLGLAMMSVFAATFLIVPRALASSFSSDAAVIAATITLLQLAALYQLSDGAQVIAAGALRGLGATRATLEGNLLGHYAVGLPLILLLGFTAGLGAPGIWWGLVAGLTVTAAYLIARFLRSTSRTRR